MWLSGKESACWYRRCQRHGFDPWVRKTPWRRKWQSTPLLSGESHEQRNLTGCHPWDHKKSDVTWVTEHNTCCTISFQDVIRKRNFGKGYIGPLYYFLLLYVNLQLSQNKRFIKNKSFPFIIVPQIIKCLKINLVKGRKDFYTENHQMLLREIKQDLNKWRNISCLWIRRLNIVKISILLILKCYQFSHSVMSDSLQPHELQHTRLSCPPPTPGVC